MRSQIGLTTLKTLVIGKEAFENCERVVFESGCRGVL